VACRWWKLALPLLNEAAGLSLSLGLRSDGIFLLQHDGGGGAARSAVRALSGIRFIPVQACPGAGLQPVAVRRTAGALVREALVMLQFTVVAVFFTLTWGFFSQIAHLQAVDLGFRRDGLLVTESTRDPA